MQDDLLDSLIDRAQADPALNSAMLRTMLDSTLIVPGEIVEADGKQTANFVPLLDAQGAQVIAAFSSPARLAEMDPAPEKTVMIRGRMLLQLLRGISLVINPFSQITFELSPDHQAGLLAQDASDAQSGATRKVVEKAGTALALHAVASPPLHLLEALGRAMQADGTVQAAWFGGHKIDSNKATTGWLVGVQTNGDFNRIGQRLANTAQAFTPDGIITDIMEIGGANTQLSDAVRASFPQFYKRG